MSLRLFRVAKKLIQKCAQVNISAVVLFQKLSNRRRYRCHYFIKIVLFARLFHISVMLLIDATMVFFIVISCCIYILKAHELFSRLMFLLCWLLKRPVWSIYIFFYGVTANLGFILIKLYFS